MRRATTALCVLWLAAVFPAAAAAEKPIIVPNPPFPDTVLEGVCEFPVLIEELDAKSKSIIFSDRILTTGKIKARLTNLDTGESVDVNISGPGTFRFDEENGTLTIVGGGPWLHFLTESDAGGPGLFFTRGRFTLVIGPDGSVLAFDPGRNVTDMCAVLA